MTAKLRRAILQLSKLTHYDCAVEAPGEAPDITMILEEKCYRDSSERVVENNLVLHIESLEVFVDLWLFL
jgi:hypothetical protein